MWTFKKPEKLGFSFEFCTSLPYPYSSCKPHNQKEKKFTNLNEEVQNHGQRGSSLFAHNLEMHTTDPYSLEFAHQ